MTRIEGSAPSELYAQSMSQAGSAAEAPAPEPLPLVPEQQKSQAPLTEPQRPKPEGVKEGYYPRSGETLFDIATKHHVSIKDIQDANNMGNSDRIFENKPLKIPYVSDATWNKYQKDLKAYEDAELARWEAERKAEQAKKLADKKAHAESKIGEAREYEHDKAYSFRVDAKTGNIIITLKEDKELGDLSHDFKLPAGHLREMNPWITTKYKPSKVFNLEEGRREYDWDGAKAKKGDSFTVDAYKFNPHHGAWNEFWGL